MCDFYEVDLKRREFMGTQKKYKDSNANLKSADIYKKRKDCPCSESEYVECNVAPIPFSCIVTIPRGYELDYEEEGGNTTILKDCTSLVKTVIWNPNSKISVPEDCNCNGCNLSYPVKIRQIKVKGGVLIRLYTFITGRPLGPDGNPSAHHPYDDTTVVCGETSVCIDSTIAYSTIDCTPDINYGLVAYFQNAEDISISSDEKIARLNGTLYVYILNQTT
ncbi:hypothetical protein [Acetivibrio cellulolyticus]|uniref:hypothetical protein n=1 Tax=Acetivibrio cellulolyticus TaxID=35830 RepID=UPI0001E2F589|nr:hypothetical protein [Acetivibrio cellulolyticus]